MKKYLLALTLVSTSNSSFAFVGWLEDYEELFRRTGTVEICGNDSSNFSDAIKNRDEGVLHIVRAVGGSASCYQVIGDRQFHDSKAYRPYVACSRLNWVFGCMKRKK